MVVLIKEVALTMKLNQGIYLFKDFKPFKIFIMVQLQFKKLFKLVILNHFELLYSHHHACKTQNPFVCSSPFTAV